MNPTKFFVAIAISILAFSLNYNPVSAEEQVCTTVYGEGVICGVKVPEEVPVHLPVEAGLSDLNFLSLAAFAGFISAALFILSLITRGNYLLD